MCEPTKITRPKGLLRPPCKMHAITWTSLNAIKHQPLNNQCTAGTITGQNLFHLSPRSIHYPPPPQVMRRIQPMMLLSSTKSAASNSKTPPHPTYKRQTHNKPKQAITELPKDEDQHPPTSGRVSFSKDIATTSIYKTTAKCLCKYPCKNPTKKSDSQGRPQTTEEKWTTSVNTYHGASKKGQFSQTTTAGTKVSRILRHSRTTTASISNKLSRHTSPEAQPHSTLDPTLFGANARRERPQQEISISSPTVPASNPRVEQEIASKNVSRQLSILHSIHTPTPFANTKSWALYPKPKWNNSIIPTRSDGSPTTRVESTHGGPGHRKDDGENAAKGKAAAGPMSSQQDEKAPQTDRRSFEPQIESFPIPSHRHTSKQVRFLTTLAKELTHTVFRTEQDEAASKLIPPIMRSSILRSEHPKKNQSAMPKAEVRVNRLCDPMVVSQRKQKQTKISSVAPKCHYNSIGHDPSIKLPNTYRFVFANLNGIPLSRATLMDIILDSQDLQLDWLGVAETHLNTTKYQVKEMINSSFHLARGYRYFHCTYSSSPLDYGSEYKPGG